MRCSLHLLESHLVFSVEGPNVQGMSSCFCFHLLMEMILSPLTPLITMCIFSQELCLEFQMFQLSPGTFHLLSHHCLRSTSLKLNSASSLLYLSLLLPSISVTGTTFHCLPLEEMWAPSLTPPFSLVPTSQPLSLPPNVCWVCLLSISTTSILALDLLADLRSWRILPGSLDSILPLTLALLTLQPEWSFYNVNLTISVLFLKPFNGFLWPLGWNPHSLNRLRKALGGLACTWLLRGFLPAAVPNCFQFPTLVVI